MFDRCKWFLIAIALLVLCAGLAAAQNPASGAVPGTLNYLEGSASIDGQALGARSIGSARVGLNQVLETQQGRVEILLTPGVFLRLDNNSAVRMISPNLIDTRVELLRGEAMVEAAEIFKENNLRIVVNGNSTLLSKPGLYRFNADHPEVSVFDGEAFVTIGDRQIKVTKGHQVLLTGAVKANKFDRDRSHDALYAWSNLRSEYAAEASMQSARTLVVGGPGLGWGYGWYWNPWWDMYGFVPGDGIFYSPFGYPFFSPGFVYAAPYYGFRHPFGYRGGALAARGFAGSRGFAGRGFAGSAHFSGGGFGGGRMGGGHR